ncbi:hypothetical protein ACWEPN_30055 [Nonomuraea wenchangensis]
MPDLGAVGGEEHMVESQLAFVQLPVIELDLSVNRDQVPAHDVVQVRQRMLQPGQGPVLGDRSLRGDGLDVVVLGFDERGPSESRGGDQHQPVGGQIGVLGAHLLHPRHVGLPVAVAALHADLDPVTGHVSGEQDIDRASSRSCDQAGWRIR